MIWTLDTEKAIESVHINGVSVLSRSNLGKCKGFLSPGTKWLVSNCDKVKSGKRIKLCGVKREKTFLKIHLCASSICLFVFLWKQSISRAQIRNGTTGNVSLHKGIYLSTKWHICIQRLTLFTQDKRRSSIMWLFYRNDDGVFPIPSRLGFHGMTCYKSN